MTTIGRHQSAWHAGVGCIIRLNSCVVDRHSAKDAQWWEESEMRPCIRLYTQTDDAFNTMFMN